MIILKLFLGFGRRNSLTSFVSYSLTAQVSHLNIKIIIESLPLERKLFLL